MAGVKKLINEICLSQTQYTENEDDAHEYYGLFNERGASVFTRVMVMFGVQSRNLPDSYFGKVNERSIV